MHDVIEFNPLTILIALGTWAFALSGATAAIRSDYDVFGILVLAFVTATGGGTLRDLLIGNTPVSWLTDTLTIWSILAGFSIAIIFNKRISKWEGWLFYFDAIGLGLFTVVGTQIAMNSGLSVGISVALGTVTGCFGGVIRDVLATIKPLIFRKEIYASAAIIGGVVFAGTQYFLDSLIWAQVLGTLSTTIFRTVAVRFHLELPKLVADS